jgi:hypothetical protein
MNLVNRFSAGDLVCHFDTGHIGIVLQREQNINMITVFLFKKVRQLASSGFIFVK